MAQKNRKTARMQLTCRYRSTKGWNRKWKCRICLRMWSHHGSNKRRGSRWKSRIFHCTWSSGRHNCCISCICDIVQHFSNFFTFISINSFTSFQVSTSTSPSGPKQIKRLGTEHFRELLPDFRTISRAYFSGHCWETSDLESSRRFVAHIRVCTHISQAFSTKFQGFPELK